MVQKSFKEYFLVPEILTPAMMNIKDFNECTRGKKKSSNVGTAIYLEVLAKKSKIRSVMYIRIHKNMCIYTYTKTYLNTVALQVISPISKSKPNCN